MQLTGSRSTGSSDAFSDWDYRIERAEDFAEIQSRLDDACVWQLSQRGPLRVVTAVDREGVLWDFTGPADGFAAEWDALAAGQPEAQTCAFWIFSFKHLKAIYREYYALVSLGIEMSAGLARDIYLRRKYGVESYKDFFAFRAIADRVRRDVVLAETTGMPYATRPQMLAKIAALNGLVQSVAPEVGRSPASCYARRAELLEVP